jgi:probable F420-dependent oxidoreductase
MRLGIVTPVLTLVPRAHAKWEVTGTIDDVARIAEAADELGIDHLTCSEHVIVPDEIAEVRGGRYWDPVATLGHLAAITRRVRLMPSVVVLGYHHPLAIAKRYATLDQVSRGRVVLGVGVGTLREEFDLLGAPFDDRGDRADDAMRAIRASISNPHPSYDGAYYSFSDVLMDPCAVQAHVPMWVGGRTPRSLRRAAELGDGWCPFGLPAEDIATMVDAASETPAWNERVELDQPFDLVLQPLRALDPLGDRNNSLALLSALAEAGATILEVRLVSRSPDHYIEQLAAAVELANELPSQEGAGGRHR